MIIMQDKRIYGLIFCKNNLHLIVLTILTKIIIYYYEMDFKPNLTP